MTFTRAEAFAPATAANLGVGFDILGLALQEPGDRVLAQICDEPGARIVAIEGDDGKLPYDPDKNTACVAANWVLDKLKAKQGVAITLYKDLPLASGLGSSAASAVAAAVAVNALLGEPLSYPELLPACLEGEAAVSGYHADNVGPSLFGGIMLITGTTPDHIRHLPVPEDLHLALVTPAVAVPTFKARAVLPEKITLNDMVAQTGGVARVVDALYRGDVGALAEAMESDRVIEPARAHLMLYLAEVRAAAKAAGAMAVVISGAGPTLCAVCNRQDIALSVSIVMKAVYDDAGISCAAQHTQVAEVGARVLFAE